MSDFVRLRASPTQSMDQTELDDLVVNRQYIRISSGSGTTPLSTSRMAAGP
jgi:hypothetical protein